MTRDVPAGYVRVHVGRTVAVAREDVVEDIRAMLAPPHYTIHAFAASRPDARELQGRGPAYAIALPRSGQRAVVRHNRHGGLLARLTRDLFVRPGGARELELSLRLRDAGIPTPAVLAHATYPAGVFMRADVMTAEIERSRDLAAVLLSGTEPERAAAWRAAAKIVIALSAAGARHHDLNAKNILLRDTGGAIEAVVLDVDRIRWSTPEPASIRGAAAGNVERLLRSARKWRDFRGARITDHELETFRETVVRSASP